MSNDQEYWPKFKNQAGYLFAQTLLLWFCGILFTRLATNTWVGPRPVVVGLTLMTLVYFYMHFGYLLTLAMRSPIVVILMYLAHVHLIIPGDFLLNKQFEPSWLHLIALWSAMTFSFLFRSELFPFYSGSLRPHKESIAAKNDSSRFLSTGKIVSLPVRTKASV